MTLLLADDALDARRSAAAGPLAPLAHGLRAELEPLLGREPYIPREKALLSREGGRCAVDGALLAFDPFEPHTHRCLTCGRVYTGTLHDRFWLYWYQLWLAERAVHGAVLGVLTGDAACTGLARDILRGYADRYAGYPNRDNVLGPSRLFFSTYLESIWLLQICIAADLLACAGDERARDDVLDAVVEPGRELIAGYDEGASNRQVWNNAALIAAARLLDRPADVDRIVHGATGVVSHLREGLLSDGTWYEGENYHLFAHRGLWYAVTMAEVAGLELPDKLVARFQEGFATPFVAALPDLTLPARRDSQYAISLRQPRFAELCELGLARAGDDRLVGALYRLYVDPAPRVDTGRARTSADVERNGPPSRLSRADLGWRSLLHARPQLPPLRPLAPASALLDAQGLGILRRDAGRVYVALDYGHSGGGHGHPDRLDLLLARDGTRWLDDMGTGSYVDPSLHWYRSTLAHDAPFANGRSQARVHGRLLAWQEMPHAGWISASARDIAPGVHVTRTLVVMPRYVVDELVWRGDDETMLDLPVHLDATVDGVTPRLESAPLAGGGDLEDGFGYVRDTARAAVAAGDVVAFHARSAGERLEGWCASDREVEWWRAVAPGPPGQGERPFWLLRAHGPTGRHRFVLTWSDAVEDVRFDADAIVVRLRDGERHVHTRAESGWMVERSSDDALERIHLAGIVNDVSLESADAALAPAAAPPPPHHTPAVFSLGEPHYRRSEETWADAGRPSARVRVEPAREALLVSVDVHVGARPLTFVPPSAVNPWDNEPAEVNGDGIQLYVTSASGGGAWLLAPEPGTDAVRARPIDAWPHDLAVHAVWHRTPDGYRIEARIPFSESRGPGELALDVIVNEMPPERTRRRGQLVLSGAAGEFVYLRGDRHDPRRLLPFHVADA